MYIFRDILMTSLKSTTYLNIIKSLKIALWFVAAPILTMDGDGDQDVKVSFTKPQSLNHCMSVKSLTSGTFKRYPVSMYTQFTILFMRCTYCINRDLVSLVQSVLMSMLHCIFCDYHTNIIPSRGPIF